MIEIPTQLKNEIFRFVLIEKESKKPFQKDWTTKTIKFDNKELLDHLARDGNYGIRGGGEKNLVILDFDNEEIQEELLKKLPKTFSVKTGSGKLHLYYFSDNSKSFKIFDSEMNTLIDVQGEGKQVIGPGSIHPNGNKYEVYDTTEISNISYSEIKAMILPYNKKIDKKTETEEKQNEEKIIEFKKKSDTGDDFIDKLKTKVDITKVLSYCGVNTSKNPTACPFHTSKGGQCLSFHNDVAHCFHCDKSWNIFSFISEYKKCSSQECIKILADIANMNAELEESKKKYLDRIKKEINEKQNKCDSDKIENFSKNRPEIIQPAIGKLISSFAVELANNLKNTNTIFYRPDSKDIVEIGRIKINDIDEVYNGFIQIKPNRFITLAEKYVIPGIEVYSPQLHDTIFKRKSISSELANTLLCSEILQKSLPKIVRIFTVPIPIIYNEKLTFPKRGYDERFNSWLPENAPTISKPDMDLEEAKKIIYEIFKEFCFQTKQDYFNAISALLTPFLRGLFTSFNIRTPIFFYVANRERAGKDYLAGVTGILYEGHSLEESPISNSENSRGNNNDELRKKILAAMINGRKRLHFSNNKGYINNAVFEAIATAEKYSDRLLGRNEILTFDNELDFSLSGNAGVGFTPDFANRCRFIRLFLDIENANQREFEKPKLHEYIKENRDLILSALYSLVRNWINTGCKKGSIPFASFHQWATICGGIMESANYSSPCIADKEIISLGGDSETSDMKTLFELCYEKYPEQWIKKNEIRDCLSNSDSDLFRYLDFNRKSDQTMFGTKIKKYIGRVLSDIRLVVKDPAIKSYRQEFKFTKNKIDCNLTDIFSSAVSKIQMVEN